MAKTEKEDEDSTPLEFPQYEEIFIFLELELGLATLSNDQKNILGRAILDAHTAYNKEEYTSYERGILIAKAIETTCELKRGIDTILTDAPLCHLSFLPNPHSNFNINRMMRLQTELSDFKSWLVATQKSNVITYKKPMGRPSDGSAFLLLVFHLRNGWKQALEQEATTISTNNRVKVQFRSRDITIGCRGGAFPYFVYAVESMVGKPQMIGHYGDKVEAALKEVKKINAEYTYNEGRAILLSDD